MGSYFLDSSALVKCYVQETGTAWVRSLIDPSAENNIFVVRLAEVEVTSAISRRSRAGAMPADSAKDLLRRLRDDMANEFSVIEVTPSLVSLAAAFAEQHGLRAYDAVQLAAASQVDKQRAEFGLPRIILVTADIELIAAAIAEGLVAEDPNRHP